MLARENANPCVFWVTFVGSANLIGAFQFCCVYNVEVTESIFVGELVESRFADLAPHSLLT